MGEHPGRPGHDEPHRVARLAGLVRGVTSGSAALAVVVVLGLLVVAPRSSGAPTRGRGSGRPPPPAPGPARRRARQRRGPQHLAGQRGQHAGPLPRRPRHGRPEGGSCRRGPGGEPALGVRLDLPAQAPRLAALRPCGDLRPGDPLDGRDQHRDHRPGVPAGLAGQGLPDPVDRAGGLRAGRGRRAPRRAQAPHRHPLPRRGHGPRVRPRALDPHPGAHRGLPGGHRDRLRPAAPLRQPHRRRPDHLRTAADRRRVRRRRPLLRRRPRLAAHRPRPHARLPVRGQRRPRDRRPGGPRAPRPRACRSPPRPRGGPPRASPPAGS